MNLRQLEVFNAVMRFGSVTGAARELGVSQPAVSKILRHAEDQLGMRLFERLNGRLQPTMEAKAIQAEMEQVFDGLTNIRQRLVELKDARAGYLRIACTPALAFDFLPRAIAIFKAARPNVRVDLRIRLGAQVVEEANAQAIDVGLLYNPRGTPMAQHVKLGDTALVCAFAADHPLAAHAVITPRHLDGLSVICTNRDADVGEAVDAAFAHEGADKTQFIDVNQTVVACSLARHGLGVALVEELTTGRDRFDSIAVRPFVPRVAVAVGYLLPRDRSQSRLTRAFLPALGEAFADAVVTA